MPSDLPGAHATCVHRDDLLVEPGETALILGDQLRIEARLAVARNVDLQLARLGCYGLPAIAVAHVTSAFACRQMVIHLSVQRALRKCLLQRVQQTALLKCGTGGASCQQLVEKLIRYSGFFASGHRGTPFYPLCPPTHENHDSPVFEPSDAPFGVITRLRPV